MAATARSMIDTASKVGPLSALDVDKGRLPHVVPAVPAPKVAPMGGAVEEVVEGEGEGVVLTRPEEADAGPVIMVKVTTVGAAEAEDKMFGQKVELHDCISR